MAVLGVQLHQLHAEFVDVGAVRAHCDDIGPRCQLIKERLGQKWWLFDFDEVSAGERHPEPGRYIHRFVLGEHLAGLAGFCGLLGGGCHRCVVNLVEMGEASRIFQECAWYALFFGEDVVDVPVIALELIVAAGFLDDCA